MIENPNFNVLDISLMNGIYFSTFVFTEQPSKAITMPPPGSLINELGSFWSLVRKLQLPIGLMFLIVSGWQYPLGLVINILLLIYCSRPSRYSIYLFLQEVSQMFMLFMSKYVFNYRYAMLSMERYFRFSLCCATQLTNKVTLFFC